MPRPRFGERLSEVFVGAPEMDRIALLISTIPRALQRQFPLCHVDRGVIEDKLVNVAEEIAAMRRRTKDANPELPEIEDSESILVEATEETPSTDIEPAKPAE